MEIRATVSAVDKFNNANQASYGNIIGECRDALSYVGEMVSRLENLRNQAEQQLNHVKKCVSDAEGKISEFSNQARYYRNRAAEIYASGRYVTTYDSEGNPDGSEYVYDEAGYHRALAQADHYDGKIRQAEAVRDKALKGQANIENFIRICSDGISDIRNNANEIRSSSSNIRDEANGNMEAVSTSLEKLKVYGSCLKIAGFGSGGGDSGKFGAGSSGSQAGGTANKGLFGLFKKSSVNNAQKIEQVAGWVGQVNPNYSKSRLYQINCGSCAFAVDQRLSGRNSYAVASITNIGTDAGMEQATGKKCEYMPVGRIAEILKERGAGSHLIVGINRHPTPDGQSQSGHWFNAYYDGTTIHTVEGQSGSIDGWPPDYGDISEWCALI